MRRRTDPAAALYPGPEPEAPPCSSAGTGAAPAPSEERGHPRLRARHLPFTVGQAERDAGMRHMAAAVEASDADDATKAELLAYFEGGDVHDQPGQGPLSLRPPGWAPTGGTQGSGRSAGRRLRWRPDGRAGPEGTMRHGGGSGRCWWRGCSRALAPITPRRRRPGRHGGHQGPGDHRGRDAGRPDPRRRLLRAPRRPPPRRRVRRHHLPGCRAAARRHRDHLRQPRVPRSRRCRPAPAPHGSTHRSQPGRPRHPPLPEVPGRCQRRRRAISLGAPQLRRRRRQPADPARLGTCAGGRLAAR